MKMINKNGGRALIVHIISAGACVSGRSVWLSKCSKCALGFNTFEYFFHASAWIDERALGVHLPVCYDCVS